RHYGHGRDEVESRRCNAPRRRGDVAETHPPVEGFCRRPYRAIAPRGYERRCAPLARARRCALPTPRRLPQPAGAPCRPLARRGLARARRRASEPLRRAREVQTLASPGGVGAPCGGAFFIAIQRAVLV